MLLTSHVHDGPLCGWEGVPCVWGRLHPPRTPAVMIWRQGFLKQTPQTVWSRYPEPETPHQHLNTNTRFYYWQVYMTVFCRVKKLCIVKSYIFEHFEGRLCHKSWCRSTSGHFWYGSWWHPFSAGSKGFSLYYFISETPHPFEVETCLFWYMAERGVQKIRLSLTGSLRTFDKLWRPFLDYLLAFIFLI